MNSKPSLYKDKTDEMLVSEFVEGSTIAFNELVSRYKTKMFVFIYYQINHHQDAEDLTQEVFIQLHRKAKDFRNESGFVSFLYAMAKFIVLNYFRSQSRSIGQVREQESPQKQDFDDNEQAGQIKQLGKNPEQISLQKTRVEAFKRALLKLKSEERQLLYLHDHENFTYHQISQMLDIKVGTVRSRLHICRQKLLGTLKGETDEL